MTPTPEGWTRSIQNTWPPSMLDVYRRRIYAGSINPNSGGTPGGGGGGGGGNNGGGAGGTKGGGQQGD